MSIIRQYTQLVTIVTLLIFHFPDLFSQQVVDGSRAVYTRINRVSCDNANDPDTIYVTTAVSFAVHDTVLVFQTIGASANPPSWPSGKGEVESMFNTGKYAIFKIGEIIDDTTIVLNTTLPNMKAYMPGEAGQLIKIPTYERATVEPGFDFPAWDPVTKTGGIFPLIIRKTLYLNAEMNASGKGFKGAQPAGQYTNDCSDGNLAYLNGYYAETAQDTAGEKGGSLVRASYGYTRGKGHLGSGGGGGNGKFSGGGGGGNKGQGGNGGSEASSCPVPGKIGGEFGPGLGTFYSNNTGNVYFNRIYLGGGGGTGTQDPASSRSATRGGNGGGIIIVIADTLVGNGNVISANGESVSAVASAGAGGGGAGGVVVLNVETYVGNLNVQVRGGNGGNTMVLPDSTGPGGGGGGGMIWYKGANLPATVTIDTLHGNSGKIEGTVDKFRDASKGSDGNSQAKLIVPIRGFIINTMPDDQTICQNESPNILNALVPMGGSGAFFYKWQESLNAVTWNNAAGPNPINQRTYQPPVLTDTMYYRRIVTDQTNADLADTSFFVTILVEPDLVNNIIASDDTVCYNLSPGVLSAPTGMSGGLGIYDYHWIRGGTDNLWSDATGTANQTSYSVPLLTDTTLYKRIVTSGVCVDTSNKVTITVLSNLTGNTISAPQTLCNNQSPAALTGPVPSGGDPADKRYFWEVNQSGTWNPAGNTSRNYSTIGPLSEGFYSYRRTVFSGSDDACVSISNALLISVLPDITNNVLLDIDTTICAGLPSLSIAGNVPSGGNSPDYNYVWQSRPDGSTVWTSAAGQASNQVFEPGSLGTSTWVRRTVYSGAGDVCMNVSDSIKISTLPAISGNTISAPQSVCEGIQPADLTGSTPSGGGEGPGTYSWKWQKKSSGDSQFTDIATGGAQKNYAFSQALNDTTLYRRIVLSGPSTYFTCKDTSATLKISVPPAIGNNLISGPSARETCVGTQPPVLQASGNVNGGNGAYSYTWEESPDGISWVDAQGVNSETDYQPTILNNPMQYRRIVQSATVCSDTAPTIRIDTLERPGLTLLTANRDSICHLEKNFALAIDIRNGAPVYTAWYSDGTGGGSTEVNNLGQNGQIPINSFPQQRISYIFRIDSLADSKGCYTRSANLSQFTAQSELFPDAEPVILLDDSTAVCGNELQITGNPDIGINYFWTVSNPDITIDNSHAEQSRATVAPNFNMQQTYLKFYAYSPGCQNISGYTPSYDSVKVAFFEQPGPLQFTDSSVVVYITDKYTVHYNEPNAGQMYWTVLDGDGKFTGIASDSTLIYDIPENQSVFRLTISNGNCVPVSDDITINRRNVNVYDGISPKNADGINDFLVAEGLDTEDVNFTFQVFSTSGLLVKEITDKDIDRLGFKRGLPNNGLELWDGKGKIGDNVVPAGVYYYVLMIKYKGVTYPPAKNYVVVK